MKKFLQLSLVLGVLSFAGCGPSAEEKAKMEEEAGQAVDSLMNALESEMNTEGSSEAPAAEPAQQEQTQVTESEEAPKQ